MSLTASDSPGADALPVVPGSRGRRGRSSDARRRRRGASSGGGGGGTEVVAAADGHRTTWSRSPRRYHVDRGGASSGSDSSFVYVVVGIVCCTRP